MGNQAENIVNLPNEEIDQEKEDDLKPYKLARIKDKFHFDTIFTASDDEHYSFPYTHHTLFRYNPKSGVIKGHYAVGHVEIKGTDLWELFYNLRIAKIEEVWVSKSDPVDGIPYISEINVRIRIEE